PQAKAKAAKRLAKEQALGEVGKLLAECSQEVQALTGAEQLIAGINQAAAMASGYTRLLAELDKMTISDKDGMPRLHPYEDGLRHWTRLHAELMRIASAIGIEERLTAIAEAQADQLGSVLVSLVTSLGCDVDDPANRPAIEAAMHALVAVAS